MEDMCKAGTMQSNYACNHKTMLFNAQGLNQVRHNKAKE